MDLQAQLYLLRKLAIFSRRFSKIIINLTPFFNLNSSEGDVEEEALACGGAASGRSIPRKIETRGRSRQQQQAQGAQGPGPPGPADPGGGGDGDDGEEPRAGQDPDGKGQVHHQIATRLSTGRLLKRTKRDFSPPGSPPKKQGVGKIANCNGPMVVSVIVGI